MARDGLRVSALFFHVSPTVHLRKLKLSQTLAWTQSQLCGARCSNAKTPWYLLCHKVIPAPSLAVHMFKAQSWFQPSTHACQASRLRVPSRVIPLPVAVGGPCSFHTCLYSRHGQHCSSQQPWLRARNTEPTGSVETCNGGTEHLGTAHIFGFLWGISRPPPSCLQLPAPHTIVSASGCVSQGAEPQLACLALP